MTQATYQEELAEIESTERHNRRYLGVAWTGIFSGFTAMVIGLSSAAYNEFSIEKSDLVREYHTAQQTINTLRRVEIDNPQYLDEIISGVESRANKILRERGDEIIRYNEEAKRKTNNAANDVLAGFGGGIFALLCANWAEYLNKRKIELTSRREELERMNRRMNREPSDETIEVYVL